MIDLDKYKDKITFKQELEIGGISVCRDDVLDLITSLRQEEKDAARYRFLRDKYSECNVKEIVLRDNWELAIDEAMQCSK